MKKGLLSIVTIIIALMVSIPTYAEEYEVEETEAFETISDNAIDEETAEDSIDTDEDEDEDELGESITSETISDNSARDIMDTDDYIGPDDDDDWEDETDYTVEKVTFQPNSVVVTMSDEYVKSFTVELCTCYCGVVKDAEYDENNTVWIHYQTNELQAWNPNIDEDPFGFIPFEVYCKELVKADKGHVSKYVSLKDNEVKRLASFEELNNLYESDFVGCVLKDENEYGFYDYTFVNEVGIKESCISQIAKKKYLYDGDTLKAKAFDRITFNEDGDVIALKKNTVYILTVNKKDKYLFKCLAKKVQELHINEESGIADYIILKNGKKIECYSDDE